MREDREHILNVADVLVPTVCNGCYNCCGIRIHRVNGKVIDIVGDPDSPNSNGRICAKGKVRMLELYHPERVLKPLRRTNPEKGLGVDPLWEEISWDEAMDIVVEKLKKVKAEDPRKLIISHFDLPGYRLSVAFGAAFGTPNLHWNRADYCGSGSHPVWLITNGTLNSEIYFELCRYIILWGTQLGHMVNTIPLASSNRLAKARRAGAKLVVIDPFCSHAASKADEWVPIKPGTDGALALAMLKVMVHELGIYDREFLKGQTNGVYLVKKDGHYLRDDKTGKPLVWDLGTQKAKSYDSPDVIQGALEGGYEYEGTGCRPAFQVLKDRLEKIDVEEMARITTIPSETIRRITREFCEAASVGSTIDIQGHKLPHRPVGIDYKKGAAAHKGGFSSCIAIHLLNMLVGAIDVPGGQRGVNPRGPFWSAETGPDGLLVPSSYITKYSKPYPGSQAAMPQVLDLRELFPVSLFTRGLFPMGIDDPERFGIPYKPEVLIHGRTNLMMSSHNAAAMADTLKRIPFQVSINMFVDETSEFADIFLPDASDMERWEMFPANDPYAFITPGPGDWFWLMRQPVLEPAGEARPWTEVYLELAERLNILDALYQIGNTFWIIDEANKLKPGERYSIREIADRQGKTIIGPHFSFDLFKESPCVVTRPKTVEEMYPRMFFDSRIPIYFEYFLKAGEDLKVIVDKLGIPWDFTPYSPTPVFIPCEAHRKDEAYDLIATNHKLPFHTFSVSGENIYIDEISAANPYAYKVMLNSAVARQKGLKDGERVCVESRYGKTTGTLKVTELIHPECVGIAGTFGHWAKKLPISYGKGAAYGNLLPPPNLDRIDTLSGQVDMCVRVKIYRVEG